jgi:hypothetical protein
MEMEIVLGLQVLGTEKDDMLFGASSASIMCSSASNTCEN